MNETKHFNGLTEAEAERLAILVEECAEVIVAIGKIQRHGYESYDPTIPVGTGNHPVTNRQALEDELGDVRYAMIMMCEAGDLRKEAIHRSAGFKRQTIKPWLHHQ